MKILFVTNSSGPDYMSDMVFHGGKKIFGKNFFESKKLWYMYDDVKEKHNLYGRGFTMYGKIDSNLFSDLPDTIESLITNKFFDKIIYGSIWKCSDYIDLVSSFYKKEDIIIIDGEDHTSINYNFLSKGKYFKRELTIDENGVHPINFSIPEELVLKDIGEKTKFISDIIPNFNRNYSFSNEMDYYQEYSNSWFAITKKKGGWDCLRHYEIMMNGCIPIFDDLENCPKRIMVNIPKKEILKLSKEKNKNIDDNKYILEYTRKNLTTTNILNQIL